MPIGRYHQIDKTAIRYVGGFEIENQEQYERLVKQFGEFISILRRKRLEKRPSGDGDIEQSSPQQDGADQPATAVESKAEGEEKPKTESDGRSQ